jgi:hypothetical protein
MALAAFRSRANRNWLRGSVAQIPHVKVALHLRGDHERALGAENRASEWDVADLVVAPGDRIGILLGRSGQLLSHRTRRVRAGRNGAKSIVRHLVAPHDFARLVLVLGRSDLDEGRATFEVARFDLDLARGGKSQRLKDHAGAGASARAENETVPGCLLADVLALLDHEAHRPALVAGACGTGSHLGDAAHVGSGGYGHEIGHWARGVEIDLHWLLLAAG